MCERGMTAVGSSPIFFLPRKHRIVLSLTLYRQSETARLSLFLLGMRVRACRAIIHDQRAKEMI
jgi:hypothetical protein